MKILEFKGSFVCLILAQEFGKKKWMLKCYRWREGGESGVVANGEK